MEQILHRKAEEWRYLPSFHKSPETYILSIAGGAGSNRGTGGMITKIHAAQIACSKGIDMAIIQGENPDLLYDLMEGKEVGTHFIGGNTK